ncbi:YqkE family protein [Tumebacillus flagellatus]|uniref:Uncharacterized protein n=1 Tax=Tumebacillus flagellatus TaxID=1157490 RepID=A0A074MCH0_9BACL|nr:YqkE family protein [Tumebacillus flagellatus]KEO83567.1 hypothetical protein EL26_09145 [Tumebacillus flagellatus]
MARKHRHRENGVTKMHTIIGGFEAVFDDLAKLPQVQSVITGVISPNKSEHEELTFQYFTDSGLKLLAKTTDAVQEVFLVAKDKHGALAELRARGHLNERVKSTMSTNKKKQGKKPASGIAGNTPRRDQRYNQNDLPKDKPTTLKDLLSPEQLAKLTEQSNELKEKEKTEQEAKRKAEVDRREKEKKELESNFEYLLNNSKMDWKNFK